MVLPVKYAFCGFRPRILPRSVKICPLHGETITDEFNVGRVVPWNRSNMRSGSISGVRGAAKVVTLTF